MTTAAMADTTESTVDVAATGGEAAEQESSDTGVTGEGDESTGSSSDQSTGKGSSDAVPETYADFELPEGMTPDSVALTGATDIFKEVGLTQENAQKLVSWYAAQVQAGSDERAQAFAQLKDDWADQAQKDKEIGGEHFEQNVQLARRAVDAFGTPELKQLLDDFAVGNHPAVIRFMMNVGKTLQEDVPAAAGHGTRPELSRVEQLYGNS